MGWRPYGYHYPARALGEVFHASVVSRAFCVGNCLPLWPRIFYDRVDMEVLFVLMGDKNIAVIFAEFFSLEIHAHSYRRGLFSARRNR